VIARDGVAGLACLAGSLALLALARGLPEPALVPIGPAFYPRILLAVTAVLGAALLVADLRRRRRPAPARAPASYRLVVLAFATFAAYVFLLPVLGYRVATFLFVAALQPVLDPPRRGRWWVPVALGLVTTLATYLVFERYLTVLLPRGRLTGF
jgi:hypothetical protein